jgi:hypothetical protein
VEFIEFLEEAVAKGEAVNLVFEERLFNLVGILQKIADSLTAAGIPYELVGGLAVLIHVEEADPTHSVLTRDVDILVNRSDLERVVAVAESQGFRFRHAAGVDMLLYGDKAPSAVHLLFSGENVKATQAAPNPAVAPERKTIKGQEVAVIPVTDLVRMKLSANRDKDRVHLRSLDAAGLITPEIERGLPKLLRARLQQVRETE